MTKEIFLARISLECHVEHFMVHFLNQSTTKILNHFDLDVYLQAGVLSHKSMQAVAGV